MLAASNPNGDVFLAKLNPDGKHVWSKCLTPPDLATSMSSPVVRAAPSGSALLIGSVQGPLDLGGGPLDAAGGQDILAAKLSP